MYRSASQPSTVPARRASRKMSPVEMCGTPRRSWSSFACVPLPAPGGPMITARTPTSAVPESGPAS